MLKHLWEYGNHWHNRVRQVNYDNLYVYKCWSDFVQYRPWQLWKPYDLVSWAWKTDSDTLQIVFYTHNNLASLKYVEVHVQQDEEKSIREWLKRHMPNYWQLG
jgi:hypothetical protein